MTGAGPRSPAADPPPELVARFKAALERLWPEGGRLGLAVSGGPDSLAMLRWPGGDSGQFEVATVDHGLSPKRDECGWLSRLVGSWDPCAFWRSKSERAICKHGHESRYMHWVVGRKAESAGHRDGAPRDDQAETC